MPTPPPIPAGSTPSQPPRGWFTRNWAWFLPLGCLGVFALGAVFAMAVVTFVFGVVKSSEPYRHGIGAAKNNPEAVQALGLPIREGYFVAGKINVTGDSGTADLQIPVSGSKAKGKIYVVGEKKMGTWHYEILRLKMDGSGDEIDLGSASEGSLEAPDET